MPLSLRVALRSVTKLIKVASMNTVKNWAYPGLFFVYFCSFLITISIQTEKNIDGVLVIRTWGRRMVGADKTT